MATNEAYETLVSEFLTANGATFIAPQYAIKDPSGERGGEWSRPDFLALRPAKKECFIVEVSVGGSVGGLLNRVNSREHYWFGALRKQLESQSMLDSSWKLEVLVFLRKDQMSGFKKKLIDKEGVYLWPMEYTATRWLWHQSVWTQDFDLRNVAIAD